jgi:serine/threonine protein kinase/tetratricopeptide (TPR) repeat protein
MLCTYCGATTSPTLDRCVVCHTPYPASVIDPDVTGVTDLDEDRTRLTPPSSARPPEPPLSGFGDLSGVPRLEPGHSFANRYTIIRLLGAGGMAAVYQAWDETLATAVALKLIRVDPMMLPDDIRQLEERFKRELKLARQVTHPNVIRIHDLGEVGRTMYITMAYVQGSDLATVLQKEQRLPVPRALSLARQIVSGLAAAHRAGVVHRDLKPANILVDATDQALLTDFGIARSKGGEQAMLTEGGIKRLPPTSTLQTMPGAIMGTLEYMAPEQVHGEPADERTDIYAFGLILYELIAGSRRRPAGEALQDIVARIEKGPPALETVVPEVPPDVARIVSKCLHRDPAERYATADDLLTDLEQLDAEGHPLPVPKRIARWKILTATAALASVLVGGTWWAASNRVPPVAPIDRDPVPILVADFENRAQDPVFEGALEQALNVAMEGAPFITAYPRKDATAQVKSLNLGSTLNESSARLLATREGIRVILAGSIERSGTGYQLSVRAIDPEKPEPIATANERASNKGEVLAAIDRLAEPLREALGDSPSEQQPGETFTAASLEAVRAYTEAQDLAANQKDAEAIAKFDEAIKYDKEFARAYAGKANSLYYLGDVDGAKVVWQEALKRTDRMTEREKLRTNGTYLVGIGRDYPNGINTYEDLVSRYPADSAGYNNLAVAYFNTLDFRNALENGKKAIDIYPNSFKYRANYALYAMYASDFKTAGETAKKLTKEDPRFETAYLPLAMEAIAAGKLDEARGYYETAAKAGPSGASLGAIGLADLDIYQARYSDAISKLPAAAQADRDQGNDLAAVAKLMALADAYHAIGQKRDAQAAMEKARALSTEDNVLVPLARMAVATGQDGQARSIADVLSKRVPQQSRAYAHLIEAEIQLRDKAYPAAIDALNAARKLADLWLVRYLFAITYFQLGNYVAATPEFEKCRDRRGEATALFLDDLPTVRYYAEVPYWLGRAREGRKLDPRTQYQEFLAIRGGAAKDPLVLDASRRLTAIPAPAR